MSIITTTNKVEIYTTTICYGAKTLSYVVINIYLIHKTGDRKILSASIKLTAMALQTYRAQPARHGAYMATVNPHKRIFYV